jgi:hypothetical protein
VPSLTSALTRTDQDGLPIEDVKPEKLGDCDPKYLAGLLLRKRRQESGAD